MLRQLAVTFALLALGCTPPPGQGSPGVPCTIDTTKPAPIFHVEAPTDVRAGQAFQLTAWYVLAGTVGFERQKPGSFKTTLSGANTLEVSGELISPEPNPRANCAFPAIALVPMAQTAAVDVQALAAGSYEVRAANFPESLPPHMTQPDQKPIPAARRTFTLVVK